MTRSCNLACKHCRAEAHPEPYPGELSTEEAKALIDTFPSVGNPIIIFTGGDPMIRPDVYELIAYAGSKGLRCVMSPNGTLITPENARKIKEAGVQRCSISIDGYNAEKHDAFRCVPGAFDATMRGIECLKAEGVEFRTGVFVGSAQDGLGKGSKVTNWAKETITPAQLQQDFDAVLLAGGAEQSRDLPVPGRDLVGVHFAMEFLPQQNKVNAGDKVKGQLSAAGKHVIVIGGGDTGSDCVGTSNRHGAASVTQFEVMPQPPEVEDRPLTWPHWPLKLRTSSSHEEGCTREFAISTKAFTGEKGKLKGLTTVQVEFTGGKLVEVPGTEKHYPADLVLLAMGFVSPVAPVLEAFGVDPDARGNARASTDAVGGYATNVAKVFAAGDIRRGQSLVVWAIREGRQAARAVDEFLMGCSDLPR